MNIAVPFDENEYASMMFNPMESKAIFLWASGETFEEVIMQNKQFSKESSLESLIKYKAY